MSTPLILVRAVKGTKVASAREISVAEPVFLLGQHDDAAALRRLIREGRELGGVGQGLLLHAIRGENSVAWGSPG